MKKAILLGILIFFNIAYGDVSNWGDNSSVTYNDSQDVTKMTGSDQLSISFWVEPADKQTGNDDTIVNQEETYEVALTTDDKIAYAINVDTDGDGTGDSWAWITTDVQLTPDEYQHIALTYDGTTGEVKIYKDGKEAYNKTDFPTGTLTTSWRAQNYGLEITNRPLYDTGSTINVSGVGIFNNTLTPEEIEKLYNGTMTAEEFNNSGAIFFAPLINDTSDIINDFNGTLVNNDTILLNSGRAPDKLKKLINNIDDDGGGAPVRTPIPLPATLITVSLLTYLLRKN